MNAELTVVRVATAAGLQAIALNPKQHQKQLHVAKLILHQKDVNRRQSALLCKYQPSRNLTYCMCKLQNSLNQASYVIWLAVKTHFLLAREHICL